MATNGSLPVINEATTQDCTDVSLLCPVNLTTYGYAPNLGANIFFCAFFAITCLVNLILGIRFKTWTYLIALSLGSFAEALGYVGRIMMHYNAWSDNGFQIQICCLIIAPAFIAAGVYLTLKHIVIEFGPSFSRLRPRLYTWIFILCDILSLILQGAGGGIAATADPGSSMTDVGTDLMITGIVWQVCTLLAFAALVGDYALRCSKNTLRPSAYSLLSDIRFKLFLGGLAVAFLTIFTRCVYRIAELGPGWRNSIMQNEDEFIVLDSVMITIATGCLTLFHPGLCFKKMLMHKNNLPAGAGDGETVEMTKDIEMSPTGHEGATNGYFRTSS